MFFLLRCAFWLGLVFSALPWDGDAVTSDLAAGAAGAAASAQAAATAKVQSLCLKDPVACARHAAEIGKALGVAPSSSTLLPGDLGPAWRGGGRSAGRHNAT